ncbi:hypothetical protein KUTeg_008965 [Tegillarca granosa]|uniref:DNA helicase Pif1-like 2B domain-containing protein n=1 Tax=Tegillarca granosa TaxID=220873 RepID=A0ABQ9FAN7_TEGGR|nr:hypothetical protein KUTeg_008965 [Tegillarca granosa]
MLNAQIEEKVHIEAITKYPEVWKKTITVLNLTLCKNARIMLVKNLDVADGLINGATGIVLDILQK